MMSSTRSTPAPAGVIHASMVEIFLRLCADAGIERSALLAAAGLDARDLAPDPAWIRRDLFERLFLASLACWHDPLLGLHLGQRLPLMEIGLLGFLGLSSPTILDLFSTLQNYGRLVSDIPQSHLRHEPGRVLWVIDFSYHNEVLLRHSSEWMLAACARLIRRLDAQALLAVHLRHAAHPHTQAPHPDYADHFRCAVRFEQAESALVLDPQRLQRASPLGHIRVFQALSQEARAQLEQGQETMDFLQQLRPLIEQALDQGLCTQARLCAQMGISERQLHRRLQQQGESYQGLLDRIRLERLQRLMRPERALHELAEQLGFSSQKSLSRWYLARTGQTLGSYRRQLGSQRLGDWASS